MDKKFRSPSQSTEQEINHHKSRPTLRILLWLFLILCIGVMILVTVVSLSPHTGAQGADVLRNLFGAEAVGRLESIVFSIQDAIKQASFRLEGSTPAAPWTGSTAESDPSVGYHATAMIDPMLSTHNPTKIAAPPTETPTGISVAEVTQTGGPASSFVVETQAPPLSRTQTPTLTPWKLSNLSPLGTTPEEGMWVPYILDASNNPLAYRTFLQPDPERPYVFVGIVAIDLTRVQLHFQLGTLEPKSAVNIPRPGMIPASEMQPGILLAAFNGGFKAINGHFGVFADGVELLPPVDGLGTLAIRSDGSIEMGEWGTDLESASGIIAYRQNCPMIVHDGEINPLVFKNSINDWGGTISDNIATFRSGIGLSQDNDTLYYFAGNNLPMPILAQVMQTAGAYQAMQLDINSYYVLFTRFIYENDEWIADPLLPYEMWDNVGRYLGPSPHDFFYLTTKRP